MPESYTVIRGQQYVTEVIAVGEDVKLVEKGDVAVVSMYLTSRNNKKQGTQNHPEGDILNYKKSSRNEKTLSFDPKTFQPGINYILVEMIEKKNKKVMVVLSCR
jgi:hypothetical protein